MARRRGRAAPRRLPWVWIGILLLLGVGLFVARSGPEPQRPLAPTSTPQPRGQSEQAPALAALPTPTVAAAQRTTATATLGRAQPTATLVRTATTTPRAVASPAPELTATAAEASKPAQPQRVVALTFDAGADRGYAEDILDLLHIQHVTASFSITGQWARGNPDLVRRMAAEGQMVFNHTLDHQSFTGLSDSRGGLSPTARRAELENADAIIAPLIGHSTRPWYRLPYGDDDGHVAADVAPAGYKRKVGWTIDTLGWRGVSADEIVDRSLRLATPGAIYVLHVGHTSQDGPALGRIVTGLRGRGYGFVAVDWLPL